MKTKVSTDACKDSLGAVLLQMHGNDWKPVAYAARSMTSAGKNYAMIEKELLGLVWGCSKFHEYIYGLDIVLETDHKPIVALSNKSLNDMSPRIQRLMLRLQKDILVSYGHQAIIYVLQIPYREAHLCKNVLLIILN